MLSGILVTLGLACCVYFAVAFGLILSQGAGGAVAEAGLNFARVPRRGAPAPGQAAPPMRHFEARDGARLPFRRFDCGRAGVPLMILVHGSGWHGEGYLPLAATIAEAGVADVVVPDLRGHGFAPPRRGDADYIGQLEDDLADLAATERRQGQGLVMAGHSSGGGLVVRFAGGRYCTLADRVILLAPFLKYNAPTTRPNSGGWARALIRRIIGLSMLNAAGITALNGLIAIRFAIPASLRGGPGGTGVTDAYSFRLNASFAPRAAYLKDIARLPPFLLVAGREDEAFFAERYKPLMTTVTDNGTYALFSGVSHLEILDPAISSEAIIGFLRRDARREEGQA